MPSESASPDLRAALAALHPACWGWALACCSRDRDDAQDVLQRAYLRILEGRARYNGTATFRTFVFGVIRNVAREEMRAVRTRRLWTTSSDADTPDPAPLPDAAAASAEQRTELVRALAQLSVRQREVLELVFYQEMTIEEAAAVMHVRVGSARTHYERGKARLRMLLSRELIV